MTRAEFEELRNDELLELITIDGFDDCIVGLTNNSLGTYVITYDLTKIIKKLMEKDNMTYDEAYEYFEFNIADAYFGETTPNFIELIED